MKTTKIFMMAALALLTAACSNDDNELTPTPNPTEARGITITAQLAPKSSMTRAVSAEDNRIKSTWDTTDELAILYEVGGVKKQADVSITSVDGGVANISFTVDENTEDGTVCTIVYPKSAVKADLTGAKTFAEDLATSQNGELGTNLDVRIGSGSIQTTTPGLTVTEQPKP